MVSKEGNALPRQKRRNRNQAVFREVNERIAEISARMELGWDEHEFVCECARVGCGQMIRVPLDAYRRVREDRSLFLAKPGHEDASHETVVEEHDKYVIVSSRPEPVREPAATP